MTMTAVNQFRVEEDRPRERAGAAERLWVHKPALHMNFPIGVERFRGAGPVLRALAFLKNVRPWPTGNWASSQGESRF